MIPTQSNLSSAADRVLKSIPHGLTHGEVDTGLYGLGFLGRWVLPRLKEKGVRLVSCYDTNAALTGTLIEGLPVHAASELKSTAPEFLFIAARHAVQPISAMLSSMKIAHASYDAWHVASNIDAFRHVHDHLLSEERSKEVLRAVLMAMLSGDRNYCADVAEKDQYFACRHFGVGKRSFMSTPAPMPATAPSDLFGRTTGYFQSFMRLSQAAASSRR